METIYDWVTLAVFAGLIVLFMQRSDEDGAEANDPLYLYLAAGVGCGVTNYFGNEGNHVLAIPLLILTLGFILHFLKPFPSKPG